jgi:hypothetical protein
MRNIALVTDDAPLSGFSRTSESRSDLVPPGEK